MLKKDTSDRVDNYYYEYTTGAKTGYTNPAKSCIVATAMKDGIEYIVVILGAETTENGLSARNLDCISLFKYAFENYTVKTLNEENSVLRTTKVSKANNATKNLNVVVKDEIAVLIQKDFDTMTITPTVELNTDLVAPISKNTVIGKITYNIDGNEYSSMLLAGSDVIESNSFNTFLTVCSVILVLFLLYKLLNSNNNSKKRKRRKRKYNRRNDYLYR